MNGKAHRLIGLSTYALLGLYARQSPLGVVYDVMATYVSSTLPDCDYKVGIPHRGITHSLLAVGAVVGAAYMIYPPIAVDVLIGYGMHLAADSLTASGVPLLWPSPHRYGLKILNRKRHPRRK